MSNQLRFFWALLGLLAIACNRPSIVGTTLIDDDIIEVAAADISDIEIRPFLQSGISVLGDNREICPALAPEGDRNRMILSNFKDPYFGSLSTEIYVQFGFPVFVERPPDNFADATVDSVTLVLPFNSNLIFGDTTDQFDIRVFELLENIESSAGDVFLDQSFMTGTDELGSLLDISARPTTTFDEVVVDNDGELDTLENVVPQIKLRLETDWANTLFDSGLDSMTVLNDTLFLELFKGIKLEVEGFDNGILALNAAVVSQGLSRMVMTFHYSVGEDQFDLTLLPITSSIGNVHNRIVHDLEGSIVADAIDNTAFGDTTILIGRHAGVASSIIIKDVDIPAEALINLGELQFTAKEQINDPLFEQPETLIFYEAEGADDGRRDYPLFALGIANGVIVCDPEIERFGGEAEIIRDESGELLRQYSLNIADELQELVEGSRDSIHIVLTAYGDIDNPGVLRLEGPQSDTNPLTLRVAYTNF